MGNQFSKTFLGFLGILLALNLLQAIFTPLIYDETYYWYYSQDLAWGYFDHPPMVALLTKISGFLFNGELGVRFLGCIMGAGTLMILWSLIEHKEKEKNVALFFLLAFSMVLFNMYGFFTLPDTPLLFFTALFFLLYKKFLNHNSIRSAVLLGLCMAALLYSKYHAVLLIFFVILSNPKLIVNKYSWLAVLVAITAYIPHFLWLFDNDFISVKYHLFERPNQPYEFDEFTLGYLLNLIVNFGLLFPWFYWALFKSKTKDTFQRSLRFVTYGIILFFFLSSFHRRSQAQWVIAICVPMVLLTYSYLLNHLKKKKWLWRIGIISTFLILYGRAWLIYHPLIPFMGYETHGAKEWVKTLNDIVGDTPVVFENSYRRAPMYAFYSGNSAFSLNNIFYRQNQYSIDDSEFEFQHQRIAYVTPYAKSGEFTYVPFRTNPYYGWYIEDFETFRKLKCIVSEEPVSLKKANHELKVYNPYSQKIALEKLKFKVAYLDDYKDIIEVRPLVIKTLDSSSTFLKAQDTTNFNISFPAPDKKYPTYIRFSISENGLRSGINSPSLKVN